MVILTLVRPPLPSLSLTAHGFRPSSQQNLGHSISVSKEYVSLHRQPTGPSISASTGCDPSHGARSSPSKATKPGPVFYFPFCFWIHAATCMPQEMGVKKDPST
jgi:hypothetical protein